VLKAWSPALVLLGSGEPLKGGTPQGTEVRSQVVCP
jgi:hypothetical protein